MLTYYADFACLSARLLIEIDGIAHTMGDRPERDELRDAELTANGWRIERIPASAVLNDVQATAAAIITLALSLNREKYRNIWKTSFKPAHPELVEGPS